MKRAASLILVGVLIGAGAVYSVAPHRSDDVHRDCDDAGNAVYTKGADLVVLKGGCVPPTPEPRSARTPVPTR